MLYLVPKVIPITDHILHSSVLPDNAFRSYCLLKRVEKLQERSNRTARDKMEYTPYPVERDFRQIHWLTCVTKPKSGRQFTSPAWMTCLVITISTNPAESACKVSQCSCNLEARRGPSCKPPGKALSGRRSKPTD